MPSDLAQNLAALRQQHRLTQEELAAALAVSSKTVSKWENDASAPDLDTLMAIAAFFEVSTDALLGLTEPNKAALPDLFEGLDENGSILKAFEVSRGIIPTIFSRFTENRELSKLLLNGEITSPNLVLPAPCQHHHRDLISTRNFYNLTACSPDVNLSVMLLRNQADFAWMKEPEKQSAIVRLFRFLSSEDTLSVLAFLHSDSCSTSFTADYVAKQAGTSEARTSEILNEFCAVGACHYTTAHLIEGETRVYECRGDGLILSLISLAFERMCGTNAYNYNFGAGCRMIGGGKS